MPHFLKRLELSGFKSFAGKTALDFPVGVTAIVGPNGSGKSNVVDAVRWLLGERDAKHLRGAKVEDLIFSGTPQRPRMGMARASLHFENVGNFFSLDAAEVSVSRETARDGMSRYFLNKSEVLLRDLIDFFARARLGSRGLVVITQGNSDIFVRSDEKARREMIEEILGLREYQLKRADAERRLMQTEENLGKARALIDEILPHLRSLKRQTHRWEKRGELETELKDLEDRYFSFEWQEVANKAAAATKNLGVRAAKRSGLEKQLRAAEAREKELESSQPKERAELQRIKSEVSGLIDKRSKLQKELGRIEAQAELCERSLASAGGPSAEKAAAAIKKVEQELRRAMDGDVEALRASVKNALRIIEEAFRAGGGKESEELAEIKHKFSKIKEELGELEQEIGAFQDREKQLEGGQEHFYREFTAAVRAVERARDVLEAHDVENQKIAIERERFSLRLEELERQIRQAGRAPQEFKDMRVAALDDRAAAEKRMFKLRGDLASMGEIDQAVMKEAREVEERYEFLTRESEDLKKACADLKKVGRELREKVRTEFTEALAGINKEFNAFFALMFGGGRARLVLAKNTPVAGRAIGKNIAGKEERVMEGAGVSEVEMKEAQLSAPPSVEAQIEEEGGIEIEFRLPKRRASSLDVLSGGERSLLGIAALFALISVSAPPFLVLDEIDAALDEQNARRFADLLKDFSKRIQFVVVTHNRATMEVANVLYGVTLGADGTSKALSLKLREAESVSK